MAKVSTMGIQSHTGILSDIHESLQVKYSWLILLKSIVACGNQIVTCQDFKRHLNAEFNQSYRPFYLIAMAVWEYAFQKKK